MARGNRVSIKLSVAEAVLAMWAVMECRARRADDFRRDRDPETQASVIKLQQLGAKLEATIQAIRRHEDGEAA